MSKKFLGWLPPAEDLVKVTRARFLARTSTVGILLLTFLYAGKGEGDYPPQSSKRVFTGDALREIAFPLGGIGTGCISLGGRGDLRNWEISNRPEKGSHLSYSFFSLWAKQKGKKPVVRILERNAFPPYRGGGLGMPPRELYGLPRLEEAELLGEYPSADVRFKDRSLPVTAELEAWKSLWALTTWLRPFRGEQRISRWQLTGLFKSRRAQHSKLSGSREPPHENVSESTLFWG